LHFKNKKNKKQKKNSAHGTHVAGIVGANASPAAISTFGSDPLLIPRVPFTGVAPNVTLGAYRVFGCNGGTTDAIMVWGGFFFLLVSISFESICILTNIPRDVLLAFIYC
jgi:subtilisin family serine protease